MPGSDFCCLLARGGKPSYIDLRGGRARSRGWSGAWAAMERLLLPALLALAAFCCSGAAGKEISAFVAASQGHSWESLSCSPIVVQRRAGGWGWCWADVC